MDGAIVSDSCSWSYLFCIRRKTCCSAENSATISGHRPKTVSDELSCIFDDLVACFCYYDEQWVDACEWVCASDIGTTRCCWSFNLHSAVEESWCRRIVLALGTVLLTDNCITFHVWIFSRVCWVHDALNRRCQLLRGFFFYGATVRRALFVWSQLVMRSSPTVASRDRLFPGCVVFVVMYATNLIWYLSCVTHVWHSVLSYWGIWRWNEMHMSTWPRVNTGEREPPIKVGIINSSVNITWNFSFNCMHLTFREHQSLNNSVGHMLMC